MSAFSIEGIDLAKDDKSKDTVFKTTCRCGCTEFKFLGIQQGKRNDLILYNCKNCGTTLGAKIEKKTPSQKAA